MAGSVASPSMWQVGKRASSRAQVPEFVNALGLVLRGEGWALGAAPEMLSQALCPLAKPQLAAGVQTPARISSKSLRALIY